MTLERIGRDGLVLLGCGKMGSAMLEGWLRAGVTPASVHVLDPQPTERLFALAKLGLHLNGEIPPAPAVCLIAVKPQMIGEALPRLQALGNGSTIFLSIAAGTPISGFESLLGSRTPVIRAMPNTPAAVGRGITALIGNSHVAEADMALAEALLGAIGQTVRLEREGDMDAVTGVSGSGPAYVFHLIETLAAAGVAEGLSAELAMKLARATVGGAGQLAEDTEETPEQLRINVTSPKGTTAAALEVLMHPETGFPPLLRRAVKAASERSRELGK